MNVLTRISKRTAMATAIAVTLGGVAPLQTASAVVYTFEWEGLFTMLDPNGVSLTNTSYPYYGDPTWGYGLRTQITGTLTYDTDTSLGSMTINDFEFFNGSLPAQAQSVTLENIGNGGVGGSNLLLGNMLFNWNGNDGIPVSVVFDATGLINDIGDGIAVNDVVTGAGAIPASNNIKKGAYPIGAAPVATTTWNTTTVAGAGMGVTPSGELPLIADTVGGSPMIAGPFVDFSANFDLTSMTLVSDGSGPTFTVPADPNQTEATAVPGDIVPVDLGTVTDELAPAGDPTCTVAVEYDIGNGWTADDGTNTENVTLTGTVTTLTVDWRATTTASVPVTCASSTITTATQTVTVTIGDTTAPTFTTLPADFSVSVASTAEAVTFEGPTSGRGTVVASDTVDPTPLVQWSLDQLNWTTNTAGDESSSGFGSGSNTVYWRVTDDAGNVTTYEQQVTLNLPTGIVGQPCIVDPDLLNPAIGNRALQGIFRMRDSSGNPVGEIDETVTGTMNTATICADESCTDSGAALATTQAFFGNLWDTETIRLFGEGTYTFDACPGTIVNGVSSDGSTKCDADNTLTLTVGPNQLGGHMLFNWSVNRKIDVAVVWDYSCGAAQLVPADPDGDGIIGTKMVDGPFKGFNAAFDLTTTAGQQPITTGGYAVTVPVVNNPTAGASPLPLDPGTIGTDLGGVVITGDELSNWGAAVDSRVVNSCVGGCFDFSVSGRAAGETIQVVLPLSRPIPWYSLYRKYNAGTDSWTAFVVNNTDSVMTAQVDDDGRCPEPGAGEYASYSNGILAGMLRPNDQCVQLTITDNGPNDDDPASGVIADPSGVGVTSAPATPEAATSDGGGCTLSSRPVGIGAGGDWLLVGAALAGLGLFRRRVF